VSFSVNAQKILDIPDLVFSAGQKEHLTKIKLELTTQVSSYKTSRNAFESKCKGVEINSLLDAECKAGQTQLEKEKDSLSAAINAFNSTIVIETDKFFVAKEQKEVTENFDVWISDQHNKVQEAVTADSNWTKEFLGNLKGLSQPESTFQPKGLKDLKNGDVLLLFPKTVEEKIIDMADKFYNGYKMKGELKASHAMVFIGRDATGRCLFLNNTSKSYLHPEDNPGGPHIIGQTEFEQLYGQRDYFVARPRDVINGKILLKTAIQNAHNASNKISILGSEYGVLGNDLECAQSADRAVAKATGRQTVDKGRFIDVTPNNFFDKQDVGRYYIISPLVKQKEVK
jgi:hypothetical protein